MKPIRAGTLNRRCRIEVREEVDDDTGDPVPVEPWPLFAEVWCALEPERGREFVTEQELVSETNGRIRIRYLPGVSPKMRAVVDGVPYEIQAVIDLLDRHQEMHLLVSQGVSDG
jgi:SPP1 family predicted phage head-tail adaptor